MNKNKDAQVSLFIVIGLVIVVAAGLLFYYEYGYKNFSEPYSVELEFCADNTPFDACSIKRPMFCTYDPGAEQLALVEDCSRCGCPIGMACHGEECIEIDNQLDFPFTIFILPLNYEPTDQRFIARVNDIKEELKFGLGIPEQVFMVVDEQLETGATCDLDLASIYFFVEDWYEKNNGKFLPAPAPKYGYRVIGIDKLLQDVEACGCGFTYMYGDSIYLGGEECSHQDNVLDHEFGHTFGLCDEYDTCIWESTNELLKCKNTRPDEVNSDCGERCCSLDKACCYGKYSDFGFNVMGSADLPDDREFNLETLSIIKRDLCDNFDICGVKA